MSKKLTEKEIAELKEIIANSSFVQEKESKIFFDGKQYSIRIPKKFIEEAGLNPKKDLFIIRLEFSRDNVEEPPKMTISLKKNKNAIL